MSSITYSTADLNEDWVKTGFFDFWNPDGTHVSKFSEMWPHTSLPPTAEEVSNIRRFTQLVAWTAAPQRLRDETTRFLAKYDSAEKSEKTPELSATHRLVSSVDEISTTTLVKLMHEHPSKKVRKAARVEVERRLDTDDALCKNHNVANERTGCDIDDCKRKYYRDGLCSTHWRRRQTYGDPLAGPPFRSVFRLDKPTGCDIDGCERPHHANGLCIPHWQRRQNYGDPLAGPPLRKQRQQTSRGIGKRTQYHVAHGEVRKARGPAWQHTCAHCGQQAQTWATLHETAGEKPDDFMPLCWSCHAKYDDLARNFPDSTGSKRTPESRERMRLAALKREARKREARESAQNLEGGDG